MDEQDESADRVQFARQQLARIRRLLTERYELLQAAKERRILAQERAIHVSDRAWMLRSAADTDDTAREE